MDVWSQNYDPFGSLTLSFICAAIPVVVMLVGLGFLHMRAHMAALAGLVAALVMAVFVFGMPAGTALMASGYGAAYGLMPIGWIVLNIIFLHRLTVENGSSEILQNSIARISDDRRLQLLLIAFAFGAFFEGAAGFGTPVAVTAALLIGLGFSPLAASGLSLIANTAPVAFGALGTPVIALSAVTGLDLFELSGMIGRQLPFFSVIVPFWLIWAFAGWRGMLEIWPAILVCGVSFAVPQYLVSNFHGPWLVDIMAAICSMGALVLFLRVWSPRTIWRSTALLGRAREEAEARASAGLAPVADAGPIGLDGTGGARGPGSGGGLGGLVSGRVSDGVGGGAALAGGGALAMTRDGSAVLRAWMPWMILTVFVFVWGIPQMKALLDGLYIARIPFAGLHEMVQKVPPVVAEPLIEPAVWNFNILSMTGSGIFLSALVAGLAMGFGPAALARIYVQTIWRVRYSLLTIAIMLALGYLTRYSGLDATLGLAFAQTGPLYPLFGTLLGWLGVALTGSDTASNVLFGGLQRITAEQIGISAILMASANSSGGVMGKMIDAQSIVVASTATGWKNGEGPILRYVFRHSIVLAILVGLLVTAQAYLWPFTLLVPPF